MDSKQVLAYFSEIMTVPRESGHEELIIQYLQDFAHKNQLACKTDEAGNVLITKPASKGCENAPTIMLQSHSDMVREKNNGVEHDFAKDPIRAVVEDGSVDFEGVFFKYSEESAEWVLQDVSFTIRQGETFAILGGTGSGKSTLVDLLDRLYDLKDGQGTITMGGVDIRQMKREQLRKNIGLVLQEPFLFSQTIGENIRATRPGSSFDDMRSAAAIACVDEAITAFPEGYETVVGERGVTLSGGQKQRVAIARMLMQQAPVMIFDDSLSAVDAETDAKIRKALEKRFGSASIILISHRITTLSAADKIIVLDRGRIVEEGTHDQLKEAGGIYQKIYESQTGSQEVTG